MSHSSFYFRRVTRLAILLMAMALFTSCAATKVAIEKRDLSVQTKLSDTIFLTPVAPSKKTIFVQIRNTSDKQGVKIAPPVIGNLIDKGYTLVEDPDKAHYILQVNILQAGKNDGMTEDEIVSSGFGSAIAGGLAGAAIGDSTEAAIAGAVVGGAVDFFSNTLVKDVTYTLTTDIQISEKSNTAVTTRGSQTLRQGSRGKSSQSFQEVNDRKVYQTRAVAFANKVNLEFEEALPLLQARLAEVISGIF